MFICLSIYFNFIIKDGATTATATTDATTAAANGEHFVKRLNFLTCLLLLCFAFPSSLSFGLSRQCGNYGLNSKIEFLKRNPFKQFKWYKFMNITQ